MSLSDDPRWLKARELFDRGLCFEAHEAFEELWREASGPRKELLQAMAQASAALVHLSRGNRSGATYLVERCALRLSRLPPGAADFDVPAFLAGLRARLG